MSPWVGRAILTFVLVPAAIIAGDYLVWSARGLPTQRVQVNVFTVMQQKGQKEDFGEADVQLRTCSQRLVSTASAPSCWSLRRHPDIVLRP